jgi:hypothetical protein
VLAGGLAGEARLGETYAAHLDLASRLTNPLAAPDLRPFLSGEAEPDPHRKPCLFPPARSPETDLVLRLFGNSPIPEGFDLLAEVVRRVRAGTLSLAPDGGWYAQQLWALETLAAPDRAAEAPRLQLSPRYREYLEDLFKAAYGLTRERHVKLLTPVGAGCRGPSRRPLYVRPDLSAEPLVTFYLRRALSYRFVRTVLEGAFGAGALDGLRRLTPDGPVSASLAEELAEVEGLFRGAARAVGRQLGLPLESGGEGDEAAFLRWGRDLARDADLGRDARMMAPVFHDRGRGKTKVWAFLGWASEELVVSYATPPRVLSCQRQEPTGRLEVPRRKFRAPPADENEAPAVEFVSAYHDLPTPVLVEVYVSRVLDREEFRAHCDRHQTRAAILRALL